MTRLRWRRDLTMAATPKADVNGSGARSETRLDYLKVCDMVAPGSRVLDVGCAEGELLALLQDRRGVDGRGIELSQAGVNAAVGRGLAVIQGDADSDLSDYPDDAFDYVILSQTLQATRNPRLVLENMLRIGHRAIVSFPNFGHWRIRWQILTRGRMPVTDNLPYEWYDTPNIHFCTIRDFVDMARSADAVIERAEALSLSGRPVQVQAPWWFWNLFGEQAVFLLRRGAGMSA
jgi:methionine biosynthesis protein MetW